MMAFGNVGLVAQRLEVDVLSAKAVGAGLTVTDVDLLYEHDPFVSVIWIVPVPAVVHVTAMVDELVPVPAVTIVCVPPVIA